MVRLGRIVRRWKRKCSIAPTPLCKKQKQSSKRRHAHHRGSAMQGALLLFPYTVECPMDRKPKTLGVLLSVA